MSFTSHIDELYESAKKQSGGKVRLGYIYFPNINISQKENKPGYFVSKLRNSVNQATRCSAFNSLYVFNPLLFCLE
jgi:hypothetical protein